MKKFLFILLLATFVIGHLTFVISAPAAGQHLFLRMYWIAGSVTDPDSKGTEGRWAVFWRGTYSATESAYSDDIVGTRGLSGRTAQFMVNAYQDWRQIVVPADDWYAAIVKGADNYGADPVRVRLTGAGYDFPDGPLVLAFGAGIDPPGPRPLPPWLLALLPKIEKIKFGDRLWQPKLVEQGESFIITNQPRVSAQVTSPVALDVNKIVMVLNEGTATTKTYSIKASHISGIKGAEAAPTEVNFIYNFAAEKETLPEGDQKITFRAANEYGTVAEICSVKVMSGDVIIIGTPLTFPSPVRLRTQRQVTIQYGLSKDADIDIYVFDISARVVKKITCNSGAPGGQAGGTANPNKVTWNLQTDQGSLAGSGIYVFNIVDRGRNKVLGKGKLTIVP
ncbi:hypothetical protein HZC35_02935 [Candidatus Saganbacteria bacterium]|nr:hypothetical protein [Candidatus Saganbacteria bacterium]